MFYFSYEARIGVWTLRCLRCVRKAEKWKPVFMLQCRTPYLFINATSGIDTILFLVAGYVRRRMLRNWSFRI